jgi:N-carbamoyl-L-amino-acid hydrolase
VFAPHAPTAMLFVRNPSGISHAPDEYADADDCATGVQALADVLETLLR